MNCVRCGDDIADEFFAGVDGPLCPRCLKKIYAYRALRSRGLLSTTHNKGGEIMAKSMNVLTFLGKIAASSDDIPVVVKDGARELGTAKSLRWLELHGSPGILEARLEYAIIGRESVILQIRLKDYNTKI